MRIVITIQFVSIAYYCLSWFQNDGWPDVYEIHAKQVDLITMPAKDYQGRESRYLTNGQTKGQYASTT